MHNLERAAEAMGVSVYLLVKRRMRYRRASVGERCRMCAGCQKMVVPKFLSGREGMQCQEIGVMDDSAAWVNNGFTCDNFN
ncbi:MAG: hypothetical protein IMZ71_00385 [Chloroflexi bacterium]|nr:hypothetical protein [Chloroflexota bacterium]